MDSIYILLFTLLLYVFFGKIVDVFISTKTPAKLLRIKIKVFFHTFVAPIIFAFVILFVLLTDNKAFNIFFGCGLILGSLIRIFYTDRNYLTEFRINKDLLNIDYLTPFLKAQSRQFNLIDISTIEIVKANWLIDYPASVNVRHKKDWLKFEIIDKKLIAGIQKDADAANIGFGPIEGKQ